MDAVDLLTARRDHLQRLLDEQFAAALAALDGIREQKRSALHATLRHALTAAGEVATVTAAGSAVMASALDHAARINVARRSLSACEKPVPPPIPGWPAAR